MNCFAKRLLCTVKVLGYPARSNCLGAEAEWSNAQKAAGFVINFISRLSTRDMTGLVGE